MKYPLNRFGWSMLRYKLRRLFELPRRALHGWAPTDTWSLDHYLAYVMGNSIKYLADNTHGAPPGYPRDNEVLGDTDFDLWRDDLHRWGDAFLEYANGDKNTLELPFEEYQAETTRRHENFHRALKELQPWFSDLWD